MVLCCSKDVNQEDALVRRRKVNKEVEKLVDEIFESTDSDPLDVGGLGRPSRKY